MSGISAKPSVRRSLAQTVGIVAVAMMAVAAVASPAVGDEVPDSFFEELEERAATTTTTTAATSDPTDPSSESTDPSSESTGPSSESTDPSSESTDPGASDSDEATGSSEGVTSTTTPASAGEPTASDEATAADETATTTTAPASTATTEQATTTTERATTTTASTVPPIFTRNNVDLRTVGGITVAASISGNVQRLLDAAQADGLRLTGSGYRDPAVQIQLRRQNCGPTNFDIFSRSPSQCTPPTARPGTSNHETGLAVDFRNCSTRATACYQWLNENAARFGLFNFPPEPWHWSVNGR